MANHDHGNDGRFARTIDGAERDGEAARLKSRGLTYAQIARNLGYADASGAYRAVRRALAAAPIEGGDELRRLQSEQIDALTAKAFEVLESTHYAHTVHGDLLRGPDDEPLIDDMPALHAIDRLIRLAERRSKLMGLDAPSRHEVITLDYLDAQIRAATEELARTEAGEAQDPA